MESESKGEREDEGKREKKEIGRKTKILIEYRKQTEQKLPLNGGFVITTKTVVVKVYINQGGRKKRPEKHH